MIGESVRKLIPFERQREEDDILAKITGGERVPQFVTERRRKDGSLIHVFVTVSPVLDSHGNIVGACKMARDATGYLASQKRIEESEKLFRALADNISQIAWVADPAGKVGWVNRRLEEYTGLTAAQLEDGGRESIHHPDHLSQVLARYYESMETGAEWEDIFPLKGRDGQYRWFLARAHPVRGADGGITHWVGTHTDIHDQREQTDKVRLMLHEVNHRTKNLIATVQALARRTARGEGDDAFVERFEVRVNGLATNQDLLVRGDWREVDLDELVRRQLGFLGEDLGQFEICGPSAALSAPAAEAIGMAVHELATNSLKYGALSVPAGTVTIGWEIDRPAAGLHLWWRESGGPSVRQPESRGFGTTLIAELPRRRLNAEVVLDYAPRGLQWALRGDGLLVEEEAAVPAQ